MSVEVTAAYTLTTQTVLRMTDKQAVCHTSRYANDQNVGGWQ